MKRAILTTVAALALTALAAGPETQPTPTTGTATMPSTQAAAASQGAVSRDSRYESSRFSRREEPARNSAFPVQKLSGTDYAALETRSIFVRGHYIHGSDETAESRPARTDIIPRTPTTEFSTPPERNLVFVGATEFDNDYVAFIEDYGGGQMQILKTGDPVARGKIGPISLNYLQYLDRAGKNIRVAIGQNLEGTDPPTTRPSLFTVSSPRSGDASTTGPSTSGPPGAADSIIERLKKRREAGE